MDEKMNFLKKVFQLEDKDVEWGIVEEIIRQDGKEETEYKPGLYIKSSRVYVDLIARRFYSIVNLPEITRTIHPANLILEGEGLNIYREDEDGYYDDDDMAVLVAKDNEDIDCLLTSSFVDDIFGVTIYQPGMEEEFLL